MKYFKFTINRRDYKLAIDDILFIQVSKEKNSYGQGGNRR